MSSMQKQAVLVCVICALAALLTISITLTLLKRGKEPEAPSSSAAASEEETPDGKTNYIIYGSQSDSKASIKIEKEEGVPRD